MRSPVTFAGLLPALGAMALSRKELKLVVEAMLPSQPQLQGDDPGGARMRGGRWPTASSIRREGDAARTMAMMAGMDARGFRHPPDGGEIGGPPAGDDMRSFRRPPTWGRVPPCQRQVQTQRTLRLLGVSVLPRGRMLGASDAHPTWKRRGLDQE